MEKIKHRVGVHLLAEQMGDDFAGVETYATYQGETYDLIAYGTNGEIALVGEVETASNNKEALIEDYEKLAAAPGESVWVFPSNPTGEELWGILEEEVLEHDYSTHTKQVASRLDDELSVNPEEGADKVRNYESLLSDD